MLQFFCKNSIVQKLRINCCFSRYYLRVPATGGLNAKDTAVTDITVVREYFWQKGKPSRPSRNGGCIQRAHQTKRTKDAF